MSIKKLAGWATVVFLAWYLFTQPAAAGQAVDHLRTLAGQAANSISTFLNSL